MIRKTHALCGAALLGTLAAILVTAACIIRPTPKPEPATPPPPYGTHPYASGSGTSGQPPGTGTAPVSPPQALTEEEARQAIIDYMQSEKVAKMTQGFTLLAEQWAPEKVEAGTEAASLQFEVFVEEGTCIRLVAVADPGIPKLDMYLYGDASGTVLLDRDIANDNYPVVSFCSAQDGTIVAETRVESGAGWFLIHVYSKPDDGTVQRTMDVVESSSP
jgi:hypothetical protein